VQGTPEEKQSQYSFKHFDFLQLQAPIVPGLPSALEAEPSNYIDEIVMFSGVF